MKTSFFFSACVTSLFMTISAFAQNTPWVTTPNSSIGIATTSPRTYFHLNGSSMWITNGSCPNISGAGSGLRMYYDATSDYAQIFAWNYPGGARNLILQSGGGKVGIGTTNPTAPLTLKGDMVLGSTTFGQRWMLHTRDWMGGDCFMIASDDGTGAFTSFPFTIQRSTGNVSIGANVGDPQFANYKLSVNGKIRAKEIKVETGWSDFVFAPNYNLKPLGQVECFIQKNGHLEGIPSAAEVEKNGVDVGNMQSKLLMKIEELTLYTIELNKQISSLQAQVTELKKQ